MFVDPMHGCALLMPVIGVEVAFMSSHARAAAFSTKSLEQALVEEGVDARCVAMVSRFRPNCTSSCEAALVLQSLAILQQRHDCGWQHQGRNVIHTSQAAATS